MEDKNIIQFLNYALRRAFSCTVEGQKLIVSCNWALMGANVSRIEAYVCGVSPYTGKEIDKNEYRFTLYAANSRDERTVALHGNFELRFDAWMSNGDEYRNFMDPYRISLIGAGNKPYIRCSLTPDKLGWTRLVLESNCFTRLNGKLFFNCAGRVHRLPPMESNRLCCYIAAEPGQIKLDLPERDSGGELPEVIYN